MQAQLEAELAALQLREQQMQAEAAAGEGEDAEEESFPAAILPPRTPELEQVGALWARFARWIHAEGASDALRLNPPASVRDFFTLQRSIAPEGLSPGEFELPVDVAASFATHDGQAWGSVTGLIGRFYLLDAAACYAEWRDQVDMVEMGLYSGGKYKTKGKRHARIDNSEWFNRGWLPLACSGGRGLGGDLICVDLQPLRNLHRGQIILYRPESAERLLLADSLADWLDQIVRHLEAGVYKFDPARATWVAGKEATEASNGSDATSSAAAAAPAAAGGSASSTIGVHAFLYSASDPEVRRLYIDDRTEELIYLPDNDFALLSTAGLGAEQ